MVLCRLPLKLRGEAVVLGLISSLGGYGRREPQRSPHWIYAVAGGGTGSVQWLEPTGDRSGRENPIVGTREGEGRGAELVDPASYGSEQKKISLSLSVCVDSAPPSPSRPPDLSLAPDAHRPSPAPPSLGGRNYVVQYLLQLKDTSGIENVLDQLEGNFGYLSMQKYISNVVKKCLECARED